MNKTGIPTAAKKGIIIRVPPRLYGKLWQKIIDKKLERPGYSINEYITELIEKDLGETNAKRDSQDEWKRLPY